jgi:hypothetical protein
MGPMRVHVKTIVLAGVSVLLIMEDSTMVPLNTGDAASDLQHAIP